MQNQSQSPPLPASGPACKSKIPVVSVFVETNSSWGRRVVSGIIEYAKINGPWHIELHTGGSEDLKRLPPFWRPDGVIARISTSAMAGALIKTGLPLVNVSGIVLKGVELPTVTGSYVGDARIAAEHFWSKGLRYFAYIGRPDANYTNIHFDRFSEILATRGHTCVFQRSMPAAEDYFDWLRSLPKPIGILCWGPIIGHMVLDACMKIGINVPHDVAVMGCDHDDLHSTASYPEQSGIRLASEQIGRKSAEILHALLRGETVKPERHEIEPIGVIAKLSTDTQAIPDRRVASVMRMINQRSYGHITINEILEAHPMARRTMERKFRNFFGRSLIEEIRQNRVNRLRLLLASSDDPITNLAEKCGFTSYKYMGKIFAACTGLTPSEFREKYRIKRLNPEDPPPRRRRKPRAPESEAKKKRKKSKGRGAGKPEREPKVLAM